jgi:hypothetical protein
MTYEHQIQLIKRLKQQPKQGQSAELASIEAQLRKLFELYKTEGGAVVKLNVFGTIGDEIKKVSDNLTVLEQLNAGLQSGFNLNAKDAANFGITLQNLSKTLNINSANTKKNVEENKKLFATVGKKFYETNYGKFLVEQNELALEQMKIGEDAYESFTSAQTAYANGSLAMAKSFREQVTDVAELFKKLGYESGTLTDISKEFANLSAEERVVFGAMPKQLALALGKAKMLGVEMSTITTGAKGFLDYNQMITSEYELQALAGEDITTSAGENFGVAMQQAVLQRDANKQVELFSDYISKYSSKLKTNPFFLEKSAEYLGVSAEQIFEGLEGQAALNTAHTNANKLLNAEVTSAASLNETYKSMAAAEDQRSTEEKLQAKVTTEAETSAFEGKTGADVQKTSTTILENADRALVLTKEAADIAATVSTSAVAAGIRSLMSGINLVGTVAGKIGSGDILNQGQYETITSPEPQKDVFIPAGPGTVVSGPFGSFSLDPKDDILAMPGIREATAPKAGMNGDAIASAVADAIKGMSFQVTNVFDGQKIRSSLRILERSNLNNTSIM